MLGNSIVVETSSTEKLFTLNQSISYKPRDVLAYLQVTYPGVAVADYTEMMVRPAIPEDADTALWLKVLRNATKPKRKKRRVARHKASKRLNHAESVLGRVRAGVEL